MLISPYITDFSYNSARAYTGYMTITKYGHSCLVVEEAGVRVLFDPGIYSEQLDKAGELDAVVVTHEHTDHLDKDALRKLVVQNPSALLFSNLELATTLSSEGFPCQSFADGEGKQVGSLTLCAEGKDHAGIHPDWPGCRNIGVCLAPTEASGGAIRFFHPGDALTLPTRPVEVLALPVAGPWLSLADAIEYAKKVKPNVVVIIHDGILKRPGTAHAVPPKLLEPLGVRVIIPELGKPFEV